MSEASQRMIAIVDDDRAVLDSLRLLLEVMGYLAVTFESASEFLRSDMQEVECLISDHHMPNMTGLELTERLRADGSDMRILLTIASPSRAIAARAAECGINVLAKPPDDSDILDFICARRHRRNTQRTTERRRLARKRLRKQRLPPDGC